MSNLQELLRQKADLERRIASEQSQSRADAIAQIRTLMSEHGLTAADLTSAKKSAVTTAGKGVVAIKYRDHLGNQWTGRGLKPRWLTEALTKGKALEDFAV